MRFALGFVLAAVSSSVAAAPCKDVEIQVTNRLSTAAGKQDIKVIAFEYWDPRSDAWRAIGTEDRDLASGVTSTWIKNLGEAKLDSKVRVHYRHVTSPNGWSTPRHYTSARFSCADNRVVSLTVQ